ncbi:zinc finger protein 93-like [Phymastichus coffea]|uniref:zinc finger protein 93-like n=1 Tax=Phymastichus coffea TaxID=108790 RepID=UPI00273C2E34|nr:zinc finger protein 93-like [Phymastichus coffea]
MCPTKILVALKHVVDIKLVSSESLKFPSVQLQSLRQEWLTNTEISEPFNDLELENVSYYYPDMLPHPFEKIYLPDMTTIRTRRTREEIASAADEKNECKQCGKSYKWYECDPLEGIDPLLLPTSGNKKRISCERCGKTYSQQCTLWRHKKYECGKEAGFSCDQCNYRTKRRDNLKSHIINRHTKKSDGSCQTEVNVDYYSYTHMTKRNVIVGSSPPVFQPQTDPLGIIKAKWPCDRCGKQYSSYSILWRHQKYECGQVARFFCDHCNYRAKRKEHMNYHVMARHNIKIDKQQFDFLVPFSLLDNTNVKTATLLDNHIVKTDRLTCDNCSRTYKSHRSLWRHKKYECGQEAKFVCKLCDYKTKRQDCLKVHLKNRHRVPLKPSR